MIDQLYADGTYYRLDSVAPPTASPVPAPHFETNTPGARRTARRMARRAALEAASITEPRTIAQPEPESVAPEAPQSPARSQRRLWTRNVLEIARRLASGLALDEESELSPEIVVQPPPKPAEPTHTDSRPVAWPPEAPLNVVVQPAWDPETAQWPTTPLTLFPASPDWLANNVASNVEVDLNALPDEPVAKSRQSFRIDAAHTRPKPHKPPAKKIEKKVVEQVLAPPPPTEVETRPEPTKIAETVAEPIVERTSEVQSPAAEVAAKPVEPVVVAEEPKVQAPEPAAAPQTTAATPSTLKKPCVPVWEVDRFLWPVTCEKLLQDESYFAEAGEKLLAATRDGLKSLAITGSRRGEGRSTMALSLARSAAKAGLSVAVVDSDFARPQMAEMIGLEVAHSWSEAALGKIPLSEAAIKSLEDKITVLPLEASAAVSGLSLADPRVTATLRALNATFDLVILDLGPLTPGNEPLFPVGEACPVDAAVVVRDLRYASLSETQAIGQRLHAAGLEAVGIAENFVRQESAAAAA